jgi:type II secretory pathway component HofQ
MALMVADKSIRRLLGGIAVAVILVAVAAARPAQATPRSKTRPTAAPHASISSFHFRNIPVRSALQLIAEQGNFNLVLSDSVQGTITLDLDNVTWEQALQVVLRLKGLQQHVDSDTRSVSRDGG